ncbi:hypothetical protein Ahy_A10g048380 isoform A [Arachis hypogaea]|uniref:Aminotransferase-like plant mobile domain-containing protein n=1 Tax=Arachis hypogaea TaxID=3818 RepID=A0A445B504_ARAHY|nr:hypothetical protein Ahy_A10g048380 isoform A [Arachis hypogaea]
MHERIMSYLDSVRLLHIARLNDYWFKLDEPPISAFVERWHPKTHTFHMPFGECTVTLQDVAYQSSLPVDGFLVSGLDGKGKPAWVRFKELFGEISPNDCIDEFTVLFSWFQNKFRLMPANALEATVQVYARGYIMMLLSMILFRDKCLCRVANLNVKNLARPLALLQSWIFWRFPIFRWGRYLPSSDEKVPRVIATRHRLDRLSVDDMPYNDLEVIQVVHLDILRPEHTLLWKLTTELIYFASIEWTVEDRPNGFLKYSSHGMIIGTRDIRACLHFSWFQILDLRMSILSGGIR